jgi:fucose permease
VSLPRQTTVGGFALFGLLGVVQALYGPLIPALRASFHIGAATAGLILSAFFAGAIGGILLSGFTRDRIALRRRLTVASLGLCLGCAGLASATFWPAALAATVVIGLGDGVLVVAFNTVFAAAFGTRSPAMVSLLNAAFGFGAILGPLMIGLVFGTNFRVLFLLGALVTLCLVPTVWSAPDEDTRKGEATGECDVPAPPPPFHLLATFVVLFLLYEGVEANVSGWEATQLTARGFSASAAANATAVFWAALTAGRILLAPMSLRVPPERIVVVALGIVTMLMLLAHLQAFTVVAYALSGLALASVFPLAFVWLGRAFPRNTSAPSLAMMAALLGGVLFPLGVGKWISSSTPEVLPTALSLFAGLCLLTALRLRAALSPG